MMTFFHTAKIELQRLALVAAACLIVLAATIASLSAAEPIPYELKGIGITEHFGDQVDLNLTFRNEQGEVVPLRSIVNGRKPTLLFLAYYGCPNLCNLFLNGATEGLKKVSWTAGNEFNIVTISIDPREEPRLAREKKASHIAMLGRPEAAAGWHFWVNDRADKADSQTANVKKLAEQVGFNYRYDKDQDQYAHTAGMMILTPEGKVSRYLYGIEYAPNDLRMALTEAGGGKVGTIADHLMLFCYHYDPKGKKYALYATNFMRTGGGITVFIVGGILTNFWRRNRRKQRG